MPVKAQLHVGHTVVRVASCWRSLGSRNTRPGTAKIWPVLPVPKGRERVMITRWHGLIVAGITRAVLAALTAAQISSRASQELCLLAPFLCLKVLCACRSRAAPRFPRCKRSLQILLVVLLSSVKWVFSSSFSEGSEWHRADVRTAVSPANEGGPKWKLDLRFERFEPS